jgi:hypothetical protein
MQTLPVKIANETIKTFAGDALALVNGFLRVATHLVMAPVERIANACDVAGLLRGRAARAAERQRMRRAWRSLHARAPASRRRPSGRPGRRSMFSCLGFLGELT